MSFARPELLWLFAIVPLLTVFMVWAWRKKQWAIRQFVQTRLLENLTVGTSHTRQKGKITLLLVSVALIVFAVARPQWGFAWDEAKQRGLDIMVAIDASRSMATKDIRPDRLERAKLAALDLMSLAKSDRVGLVTFAGTAFLQCPLTLDDSAFSQSVRAVSTNIIPQGGTAFAETIDVALESFKDEGDNYKILVIFTDGENHEPGALEAAQRAADEGMRIFTVGVGSPQGGMIEIGQRGGQMAYMTDEQGNVVKSRLNEELLQQIATTANGFYLNLSGAAAIETLYARGLAPLPKSEISSRLVRRFFERFYWPLCLAIVLLLIEMFIPDQRRSGRKKTVGQVAALGILLLLGSSAQAAPSASSAKRQYDQGNYAGALEQYRVLKDKSPDDARIDYNAGAAAYRAKDFDGAARSFSSALSSKDEKLSQSAWYNLGNTFYQLGKNESDDKKRMETWKNALNLYDNALRENSEDADARHNRGFVNYQLEELKKQQEEQKGDDGDEKEDGEEGDEEDSKDQDKDQDGEGDEKKDGEDSQEKNDDQKKDGNEDSKDEENKDGESKDGDEQDGEKQEGEQSEPDKEEKDGKDQQPQPEPGEEADEEKKAKQLQQLGKMTPEDARRLLNARKGKARPLIFLPSQKKQGDGNRPRIEKKW
jgi:Ca-activated chloride channel family protein